MPSGGRWADLVDFAFRRTQGVDAAMAVARATAMVGFVATSNVEAARRFGLPVAGTMAHSFIEAFEDERTAFRAFASEFPDRATFLVDTYDTLGGVRAAIEVIGELGLRERLGIRIDSGYLGELAVAARQLLDQAGLEQARIFASGGLDEHAIADLVARRAPIDAYGGRPVMKLSPGKITAPGPSRSSAARSPEATSSGCGVSRCPPGMSRCWCRSCSAGGQLASTGTWPRPGPASRTTSAAYPQPPGPQGRPTATRAPQ
jgi:nicotinate phosphoribosyltransferase